MPPNQVKLVYNINVGLQPSAPGTALYIKAANINFDPGGDTAAYLGMNLDAISQTPGPNHLTSLSP